MEHRMSDANNEQNQQLDARQAWERLLLENPECGTVQVERAGKLLGLSRVSAYAAAKNGSLPTIKFGRSIKVPKPALKRLLGLT
jgi:excisionase family DNA binding protein